jgi:hypothetical protein
LQPAKGKVHWFFGLFWDKKNNLKKACLIKNKLYFCTRFDRQINKFVLVKIKQVRRHIELTAVSMQIGTKE